MAHIHIRDLKDRNLVLAIVLNTVITIVQIIGGLLSGSLALLSDALHNFSDVLTLIVSYVASVLYKRKATISKTFGYKRAEILAAFINASTLVIVAVLLIIEAFKRINNPQEIEYNLVIVLAVLAIIVNGLSVLLLKKDAKNNINIKSAYLHLFTDMLASLAVLIGGLLMHFYQIYWVDSILTLLIAIYLIVVGYKLLLTSTKMLMLFTPEAIDIKEIINKIHLIPKVNKLHHIHVWSLNNDELHLEAHLEFKENIKLSEFDAVLTTIEAILFEEFNINHVNIQPEYHKIDSKKIIVQD